MKTHSCTIALVLVVMLSTLGISQDTVQVTSPDGEIRARITINNAGRPVIRAALSNQTVLEPGKLGITVDGTDLGEGVKLLDPSSYTVNKRYDWRGDTDRAHNHAGGRKITFRHEQSGQTWILDVRAYDTGVAWRYIVPGRGERRVNGEGTMFHLPSGTTLWYQTGTTTYENNFQSTRLTDDSSGSAPGTIGPPATGELPGGGYVTLAESDVLHDSGSSLAGTGPTKLQVQFHDDPDGWTMEDLVRSSWRVAIIANDLNELVSSNLVPHLAPAPDQELFPEAVNTEWVKPGRSWWTWYNDTGGRPGHGA